MTNAELILQLAKLPSEQEVVIAIVDRTGGQDFNWYEPVVGGNEKVITILYADTSKPVLV